MDLQKYNAIGHAKILLIRPETKRVPLGSVCFVPKPLVPTWPYVRE
jgi:hypothetical protein